MAQASVATQKRWLTASTGRLSKAEDLASSLRQDSAWEILPLATKQHLYDLLPPDPDGRPHDIDLHPLKTIFKDNISREIRAWQEDLREGRETKKWREEALQAGRNRDLGLWDEWKERHREETWGVREEDEKEVEWKERHREGTWGVREEDGKEIECQAEEVREKEIECQAEEVREEGIECQAEEMREKARGIQDGEEEGMDMAVVD